MFQTSFHFGVGGSAVETLTDSPHLESAVALIDFTDDESLLGHARQRNFETVRSHLHFESADVGKAARRILGCVQRHAESDGLDGRRQCGRVDLENRCALFLIDREICTRDAALAIKNHASITFDLARGGQKIGRDVHLGFAGSGVPADFHDIAIDLGVSAFLKLHGSCVCLEVM
tara:strand:- start:3814 stop:4338 length:525 start_codon:yes stop_codon:yes gene_type:complete